MSLSSNVKIVVFTPETHADAIRRAMGEAGAGKIGHYAFCSFSSKGTGRFLPLDGAHPTIGKVDTPEAVPEERIEMICPRPLLQSVITAMKEIHPYEEVAFDIYPLEDF